MDRNSGFSQQSANGGSFHFVFSKRLPEGNSQSPLRSGWFMDEICVVHFPIMIDTRQRVLIMGFHREHDKKCYRNVLSKDNIRIYSCIQCIYILYTYIYTRRHTKWIKLCHVFCPHYANTPPSWQADEREHEDPSWKFALFFRANKKVKVEEPWFFAPDMVENQQSVFRFELEPASNMDPGEP